MKNSLKLTLICVAALMLTCTCFTAMGQQPTVGIHIMEGTPANPTVGDTLMYLVVIQNAQNVIGFRLTYAIPLKNFAEIVGVGTYGDTEQKSGNSLDAAGRTTGTLESSARYLDRSIRYVADFGLQNVSVGAGEIRVTGTLRMLPGHGAPVNVDVSLPITIAPPEPIEPIVPVPPPKPVPTPEESEIRIPDRNLAAAVRKALGLRANARITEQALQRLTRLDARESQIKNLTGLEHATQLTNLDLYKNQIRNVSPLTGLTRLRRLGLDANQISNIRPLSGLTQLEGLYLGGNQLNDSDVQLLTKFKQLKWLALWNNRIGNITPLANLKKLEGLWIENNQIRDVSPLAGLVNLKTLKLSGNPIQDKSPLRILKDRNPGLELDIEIPLPSPVVHLEAAQRPPLYWVSETTGTLHRLIGDDVENLVPNVRNATDLAIDVAGGKLYWTEKTGERTGRIRRANLNGTNVRLVKNLTSTPLDLALDAVRSQIYLTNAWGKVQRLNVDGSNFQPNLITGLDTPKNLVVDVASGKVYWTEMGQKLGRIQRANLDGSSVQYLVGNLTEPLTLAVINGKLYWTNGTQENKGELQRSDLNGFNHEVLETLPTAPTSIAVDPARRLLYLTLASGEIHRRDLDGLGDEPVVTGLVAPSNIAVGIRMTLPVTNTKESSVNLTFSYDSSDSLVPINRLQEWDGWEQGVWEKTPNGIVSMKPSDYIKTTSMDTWDHWIYSHAPSRIMYAISDRNYTRFESYFDLPNSDCGGSASVRITVLANDNMEIYDSGVLGISNRNMKVSFTIPENTEMLTLEVSDLGNKNCDHFIFGSPKLYYATQPRIQETAKQHITDVNQDQKVNKTDLLLVVTALGESPPANPNFDVNADGSVNMADVLLVIEALDDPIAAAAPSFGETVTSLDPTFLTTQIDILRAESDGSPKYEHAIAFLQGLLVSIRPTETRLLANYPNPFNPETWIPYQLAKPAHVTLHIYAANGTLVRRLAFGYQAAGVYQSRSRAAYWDGRNESGEKVASGLYFYTLEAGDFTATRKMLVLK